MTIHLALTVTLALSGLPASSHRTDTARYAIIVAANDSLEDGVAALAYADDDGVRFAEVFALLGAQVWLLAELDAETAPLARGRAVQAPSRAAILQTLDIANARMAADRRHGIRSELYFVYGGHGAVDEQGEGYLNLVDARLRRSDLIDLLLRPSQADITHVIIDSCQSYFLVHTRGEDSWVDDRVDVDLGPLSDRDADAERRLVGQAGYWLSTSSSRSAHEWEAFRGGIFSHEVRSGMLGAADVNNDGVVTYVELEAYLAAANAAVTDTEAKLTPYVRAPDGRADMPFIELPASLRRVSLTGTLSGRFHLVDARGVRWADFHKAAKTDVSVVLPQGEVRLRSLDGEQRLDGEESVVLSSLEMVPVMLAQRGTLDEAFRRQLFGTAYGRDFFEGFVAARR